MDSVYGIEKQNFESYIDPSLEVQISDEEWIEVINEIEGRVDNFIDELLQSLAEDYHERVGIFNE